MANFYYSFAPNRYIFDRFKAESGLNTMGKRNKKSDKSSPIDESNAWVLTTKRIGDQIAGWEIEKLYKDNTRYLQTSERCDLTSFCYPTGSKVVRAKLQKVDNKAANGSTG